MSVEGGNPANIARGALLIDQDAQLNLQKNGKFIRRAEIREAFTDPNNDYVELLRDLFQVSEEVLRYAIRHLYNSDIEAGPCWWKDKQPIAPILRQSIIEAIDVAQDLPIYSYWLPVGQRQVHPNNYPADAYPSEDYPFEVLMLRTEQQLTRIMLTPPSPIVTRPETYTEPVDIWVVKRSIESQPLGQSRIIDDLAVTQLLGRPYHDTAAASHDRPQEESRDVVQVVD